MFKNIIMLSSILILTVCRITNAEIIDFKAVLKSKKEADKLKGIIWTSERWKEERTKVRPLFFEQFCKENNFDFDFYKKNYIFVPNIEDPALRFVNADAIQNIFSSLETISTTYRPINLKFFTGREVNLSLNKLGPNFFVVTTLYDKQKNKYFELYRMATVKGVENKNVDIEVMEYIKKFKPFIKEVIKSKQSIVSFDANRLAIATPECENNKCDKIKIEYVYRESDEQLDVWSVTVESKGKLKSFYPGMESFHFIFQVEKSPNVTEDQVWSHHGENVFLQKAVNFVDSSNIKIDYYFKDYSDNSNFVINDVLYLNVPIKDSEKEDELYSYSKCDRGLEIDNLTFECITMHLPNKRRALMPEILKKHGNFLDDVFLLSTITGTPAIEPSFKLKDMALIEFLDSFQRDSLKPDEKLILLDTENHKKFTAKYVGLTTKPMVSVLNIGSHMTGLAMVDNYNEFSKVDRTTKLAFRNFDKHNIAICGIKNIKTVDKVLQKEVELLRNKYFDKNRIAERPFTSIKLDQNEYFLYKYPYYNEGQDCDSCSQYETMVFKKENASYKFLFKMPQIINLQLCLKTDVSPNMQFFYTESQEYYGASGWAEFNEQGFDKYLIMSEWGD